MRTRQRGFTLVEIAIAIGVVGLLLAASAWMARALEERRQIEREMQRLEIVRDAIVGYAIRNRTRARILKVVPWFGPGGEWEFLLPAGRPYLPCPDYDGDGHEDRMPLGAFAHGIEVKPDLTVTVTVGELAPPWDDALTWTQDSGRFPAAHPYGECRVSRGGVPWRTLGVDPSDGWGNRHTYFADSVFSNAIFGFDRQTVADIYDPRVPSAPGYGGSPRQFKIETSDLIRRDMLTAPPMEPNLRRVDIPTGVRNCPAAICIGDSGCEPAQSDPVATGLTTGLSRCAWRNPIFFPGRVTAVFKAGLVTPVDIPDERKPHPAGSVIDGLPFVLVSHGPNGRNAVNHWATLQNRNRGSRGFFAPVCNRASQSVGVSPTDLNDSEIPSWDRVQHFEMANTARRAPLVVGLTSPCFGGNGRFGVEVNYNPGSFVWQHPGISDGSDFDDLLLWGTRGELSAWVPGNIPLLPPMVMAYFGPEFPPN